MLELCLEDMQDGSGKNRHAVLWGGLALSGNQDRSFSWNWKGADLAALDKFGKQEGLGAGRRGCQLPFSPPFLFLWF